MRYTKTRRHYEEEMNKTYVLEQKNLQLENEIVVLKNTVRSTIEIEDRGVQTGGYAPKTKDVMGQAMTINEEELESSKEIKIGTIKNFLFHKINSLKLVSHNVHSNYLVLQGAWYQHDEEITLLSLSLVYI